MSDGFSPNGMFPPTQDAPMPGLAQILERGLAAMRQYIDEQDAETRDILAKMEGDIVTTFVNMNGMIENLAARVAELEGGDYTSRYKKWLVEELKRAGQPG